MSDGRLHAERAERRRRAIPRAFRSATADGCEPRPLQDALRWGRGEIDGLLLTGNVGAGKTHLAAVAALARCEREAVLWMSVPAVFAAMSLGFDSPEREMMVRRLTGRDAAWRPGRPPAALVLDDIDKARESGYGAEVVFQAVDFCHNEGRPLLVTTNRSLRELAAKWPEPFGEGIASRLAGMCVAHRLTGRDRRVVR